VRPLRDNYHFLFHITKSDVGVCPIESERLEAPTLRTRKEATMKQQTLVIRRAIAAPREQVFDYLTSPEKMARWFYGMDVGQAKATVDLRPRWSEARLR
jgi:Activator of Hsp90 ATPase homolog 1-like protein